MNLKAFLKSGLIELYVMGALSKDEAFFVENMKLLYPEVKHEIAALEVFFEQHAVQNCIRPSDQVNQKIELTFVHLEAESVMQLDNLPLINRFSDAKIWLELVSPLLPKEKPAKPFEKILQQNEGLMQVLVVSLTGAEEEIHSDLDESFLILEGTCQCTIGDTSVNMVPGDYMQIPLYLPHHITLTSPSVTAILQHVMLS